MSPVATAGNQPQKYTAPIALRRQFAWCRREIDIRYYTELIDRLLIYRHDSPSRPDAQRKDPFDDQDIMALFDEHEVNSSQFRLAERYKSWTALRMRKALAGRGLSDPATAYAQIVHDSIPNRILAQTMIAHDFHQRLVRNEVDGYEAGIDAFNAWVTAPFLRIPVEEYHMEKAASSITEATSASKTNGTTRPPLAPADAG